jgi:hypothetical protein
MIQLQSRPTRIAEDEALVVRAERQAPRRAQGPVAAQARGGTYDSDGSAFVSDLLRETTPEHYARIPKEPHQRGPGALEFAHYFESLTYDEGNGWRRRSEIDDAIVYEASQGWRRVERLSDVRRGDVIAWTFVHAAPGAAAGRVLLVAGESVSPVHGVIAVRVFDARRTPGAKRSRTARDSFESGLGIRTLLFRVNRSGAPLAVQFAPPERFHTLPIVIGRLELLVP